MSSPRKLIKTSQSEPGIEEEEDDDDDDDDDEGVSELVEAIGNLVTSLFVEKLQWKLQYKENGNLERELSELYEILLSVRRMPYGKERKALVIWIDRGVGNAGMGNMDW